MIPRYGESKSWRDESSLTTAALDDAQWHRSEARRLGEETTVATQMAAEVFRTLVGIDREAAERVCRSLTFRFGRYKGNRDFPNVDELLGALEAELSASR